MLPQEAKIIIRRMYKGTPTEEQVEALTMAYDALDKLEHKSVREICGAMGEPYECPECGSGLNIYDLMAGHCKYCGQAVRTEA